MKELRQRLIRQIEELRRETDILNDVIALRQERGLSELEYMGAALSVSSVYSGFERILLTVLKMRCIEVTDSSGWHKELIDRAIDEGIIPVEMTRDLKGFLAFRHFIRHGYSFSIDIETVDSILEIAPDLILRFMQNIDELPETVII